MEDWMLSCVVGARCFLTSAVSARAPGRGSEEESTGIRNQSLTAVLKGSHSSNSNNVTPYLKPHPQWAPVHTEYIYSLIVVCIHCLTTFGLYSSLTLPWAQAACLSRSLLFLRQTVCTIYLERAFHAFHAWLFLVIQVLS